MWHPQAYWFSVSLPVFTLHTYSEVIHYLMGQTHFLSLNMYSMAISCYIVAKHVIFIPFAPDSFAPYRYFVDIMVLFSSDYHFLADPDDCHCRAWKILLTKLILLHLPTVICLTDFVLPASKNGTQPKKVIWCLQIHWMPLNPAMIGLSQLKF